MTEQVEQTEVNLIQISTGAELSASVVDGRPFDGLAAGEFEDMYWRSVEIKAEDMPAYAANTLAGIEASRTESGELVGLPIDSRNHDKGDAAGWITGAYLESGLVRLKPNWTDLGVELIKSGRQRMFSATVDTVNKVILGGTLTNWPATRDQAGKVLLRPIELSESAGNAGDVFMAKKETTMPELNELSDEQRAALLSQARSQVLAELRPAGGEESEAAIERIKTELNLQAFGEVADLGKAREALLGQMTAALKGEYERMQAQAGKILADMMGEIKREQHIGELAQRLTSGNDAHPRGLPVQRAELEGFLKNLGDPQRRQAEAILVAIQEHGLVEFAELGSGEQVKGRTPLPAYLASKLDAGDLKIADLSDPVLGLGDVAQFDLSRWAGKEK